jgi:hypothetical protein
VYDGPSPSDLVGQDAVARLGDKATVHHSIIMARRAARACPQSHSPSPLSHRFAIP